MENKRNAAVKLTKKNCKKVLGILEMFGEKIYFETKRNLLDGNHLNDGCPYIYWNGHYWVGSVEEDDLTLVKPRQLRNILAKEYLKEGEIAVFKFCKALYIAEFEGMRFKSGFISKKHVNVLAPSEVRYEYTVFDNFLRYATDEEKALLQPKSEFGVDEFEVGEWYISDIGHVFNYQNNSASYGLTTFDEWCDNDDILKGSESEWRKATEAEVIEALTKECVKRYGEDWENVKIKVHADRATNHCNHYNVVIHPEIIFNKNGNLFYKGKWAEPLLEPETITKDVWVNILSDGGITGVHFSKAHAEVVSGNCKTVKGTLTYKI